MSDAFDIVALAKRINIRRIEYNRLHPTHPVRITSAMSRLLVNDPEYRPYRERETGKREQPVLNPTIRTLVEIAVALDTTVGDLLDEGWPVSPAENFALERAIRILRLWLIRGGR